MDRVLQPGDRPEFIEGWRDLRPLLGLIDIEGLAIQSLGYLLELSYQAVDRMGQSYRGFNVGAAVLAIDTLGYRSGIYFEGNFTPYKGAEWNCAEKRLLEKVAERGFDRVEAIAITGPTQQDEESGLVPPTLHPCGKCRGLLDSSPLIHPNALIATMSLDEDQYELHSVQSLLQHHQTNQPQPIPGEYHPQLGVYWDQVVSFNREEELAERAILQRIADLAKG